MRKTANKIKSLVEKNPKILITDEAYQLATLRFAPEMAEVIWEVKRAFEKVLEAEACMSGCSDTYFLKDLEDRPIAVFKLERCLRELAAYRMDYRHFANVPPTVMTTLDHAQWGGLKTGSCQLFVKGSVSAVELDTRLFEKFSAASVRRLATLDIRIMNEDRHTSNILVKDLKHVIPIDHGFCFPRDLGEMHMGWKEWIQATTPFSGSELAYISLLDPEEDRQVLLDELHFDERPANRLFVATVVLKLAAARLLCSSQIGEIMTRQRSGHQILSRFEHLIETLRDRNPPNWTLFSRYVYEEVERTLDCYEKEINQYSDKSTHR